MSAKDQVMCKASCAAVGGENLSTQAASYMNWALDGINNALNAASKAFESASVAVTGGNHANQVLASRAPSASKGSSIG